MKPVALIRTYGMSGRGGPRGRRAMAVAELLIALAISGMVLAAVAYSVDTCFRAYSINQENSDLMQRSRLAMHRLISTIRTTDAHHPVTPECETLFKKGMVVTDTGIQMVDADERKVTFKFDPSGGTVVVQIVVTDEAGNETKQEYILLRGVRRFEVKLEPLLSEASARIGGPHDKLLRATVLLTLQTTGNSADIDETVAAQTVTLSTSVMPRRNVW